MRILLTGAAGLIGGELAARLLARGHAVTGLVRRARDVAANDGTPIAIPLLTGDVALPRLGLDAAGHAAALDHDLLIHCAASVRFDLTEAEYRAVNVEGTRHALELARAGRMGFLHVSTAYVCGARDGPVLETDPLPVAGFANGYEASKAAAEALVRASGLPWATARPSIVLGDSASGRIRAFDGIYQAFKAIAIGLTPTLPASPGATLDFVPVDHVAGGLVDIAERFDAAAGQAFHLVADEPLGFATFVEAIASRPQFARPRIVDVVDFDPAALPPRERRLFARGAGVYAPYFARDPRFDAANLERLSGRRCPPTGRAYLNHLIDHCIERGFLPAQRMSG